MKPFSGLGKAICAYADRIYGVPGYPASELITETGAELVINEKVALEYAIGDSLTGRRACVIVKHVGMNVLADPLVHATFQGLLAGVIVVAGDDAVAYGTQTVQDSRAYGTVSLSPVIDMNRPDPVGEAFSAAETWSRVAILRFLPEDLKRPWAGKIFSEGVKKTGRATLADPDLTMYGRAVRAYAALDGMKKGGYFPFEATPLQRGDYHERKSDRGKARSLCDDCPYRKLFDLLQEWKTDVIPDTGCSLVSMIPPYSFGKANYGLGSSPAVASKSTHIALSGDYALLHSGLLSLIDIYTKKIPLLCIILQNHCMGTTGGQPVQDILNFIGFLNPVICKPDEENLPRFVTPDGSLQVVVIQGQCQGVKDI